MKTKSMRLRPIYFKACRDLEIVDAVEEQCLPILPRDGVAERALDEVAEVRRFLGKLVAMLHEKGVLPDDDVVKLLDHYRKVE